MKKSTVGIQQATHTLHTLPMWTEMVRWEMDEFIGVATIETFSRNEYLFTPEDEDERLYLLHHGSVTSYHIEATGRKRIEQVYCPGDIFGDIVSHTARGKTAVQATGDVVVSCVNLTGFKRLMQACPSTCYGLFRYVAERRASGELRYEQILRSRSKERVVHVLLSLGDRLGMQQAHTFSVAPFTHQEIADIASLRRSTVSEVISELRRDGVIVGTGRRFEVVRARANRVVGQHHA